MKRRGFLSLLGLGGAGLMLGDLLPAAPPFAPKAALIVPSTGRLVSPSWMAYEVALALGESLKGHALKYVPQSEIGARLGDVVGGHQMTDQLYVNTDWEFVDSPAKRLELEEDEVVEGLRERYFRPTAAVLAGAIRSRGVHVLSDLPMPEGGARAERVCSAERGISLRMVRQYDIGTDRMLQRFDLIGARA